MGINQAVYTSSARGIDKGGGLGIHAYNRLCSEFELSEFQQSFCTYDYKGDSGRIPELPRKMLFRRIDGQRYMQAQVTYLGQDYAKEQGRVGNLLSHMYSFEKGDIQDYPMRLYGSPDYRAAMKQEEVDGSQEVGYLPEVKRVKLGTVINIQSIQKFLDDPGRMELFCHLLAAVLSRDEIHKVIIYDYHENIVMWLAGIQYALPLQCAIGVSFSSLEDDPTMSEFDIRGAVPGLSRGKPEDYANGGQFYVFDGIRMEYPKFDVSADYFQDGIQCCLAYAYDSMQEFYKFMGNYKYEKADLDICAGFKLFQMVQSGMDVLEDAEFQQAAQFEGKYGSGKSYQAILKELYGKLEAAPGEDIGLLKNLCIWLAGYFQRKPDQQEWEFAAGCAMKIEPYGRNAGVLEEREKVWELLCRTAPQMESLDALAKQLKMAREYRRLGTVCAYFIRQSARKLSARYLGQVFSHFWMSVPKKAYCYFDEAVKEAVGIFRKWDQEECYPELLSAFLTLQEMGEGEIAGEGMDQLLMLIEQGTDLGSLKPQKTGLVHRKKEEDAQFEQMQAKCAFEAFNYTQKNRSRFSVSRIRLLHLGRCIRRAYEEGTALEKSKALRVYRQYPVAVEGVSQEEFEGYLKILCKAIYSMENEKEDYMQLLTYWILDEQQKETLIAMLAAHIKVQKKKEDQDRGMRVLCVAVKSLKDEEYNEALVRVVEKSLKSRKEKASGEKRVLFNFRKN